MRRALTSAGLALLAACALAAPAAGQGADLLPDLDQLAPTNLTTERVRTIAGVRDHLGFDSAASNVGDGDLRLLGTRASTAVPTMRVDQLIAQTLGEPRVLRDVGVMSYMVHPDHRHWHLLGFERYELRRPGRRGASLARDRKTGFCLGDRFAVDGAAALPGFFADPPLNGDCGPGQPDATEVLAGISIGYADIYKAHIEGQFIDVTGLRAGRYVLTHRVNTSGLLAESDLRNNASSVLFSLTRPRGRRAAPRVRVLRTCPRTATCG